MPRDWKKIETDYMGGNLSYAKIAEKWGVSVRQVEEHGRKNHWTEKRREFRGKVAARAEQKAIDKRASREAEKLARLDEAAGLMLEGIARALREDPEQLRRHKRKDGEIILDMLNGGNAAALAKALETLAGVIRDANGLPGKLDKERITDMRARRKLERQKAGAGQKGRGRRRRGAAAPGGGKGGCGRYGSRSPSRRGSWPGRSMRCCMGARRGAESPTRYCARRCGRCTFPTIGG